MLKVLTETVLSICIRKPRPNPYSAKTTVQKKKKWQQACSFGNTALVFSVFKFLFGNQYTT